MLYTDVNSRCDKLVTDDRHQFITVSLPPKLTSHETTDMTSLPAAVQKYGWYPPKFK